MPTIDIKDWNNKKVGSVDLPEAIFAYPYKEHLIHEAVRNYRPAAPGNASRRTAPSERSGKKPFRRRARAARQGGNRPPIHRHGGTVFGPTPATIYKMNARKRRTPSSRRPQRSRKGSSSFNDLAIDEGRPRRLPRSS